MEILPAVFAKLRAYVEECPGEISGLGMVDVVEGNLVITDVFIIHQRSSRASTEISEDDIARFLNSLLDSGEDVNRLRLYWHSHADMDVFLSTIDLNTMQTAFPQADWALGLVLNRRGDIMACLYLYTPVQVRLYELAVGLHIAPALRTQVRQEIKDKVRQGYAVYSGRGPGQRGRAITSRRVYVGDNGVGGRRTHAPDSDDGGGNSAQGEVGQGET